MDRLVAARKEFVHALRRAINEHNLLRYHVEVARFEIPITRVLKDSRFSIMPTQARETIFRETFATLKDGVGNDANSNKQGAVAV